VLENVFYHDKNKFLFWGAEQKFTTIRFVELAHKNMCEKNVRWKILERNELPIYGKRAISNLGFFGDSRPWTLFLKLSRIVGVSRNNTSQNYHASYKKCRLGR